MTTNKRKPVRILRGVRVSEISSVDRGAGEGCHVVLRKRDGRPDYEELFGEIFGVKKKPVRAWEWRPSLRKNTDISLPPADDDEGVDAELEDDEADDESTPHFLAGSDVDEATGSTDKLERVEDAMEKNMQTHTELMSAVVKKYGITAFAKSVAEGDVSCSEFEQTKLINEHCARKGLSFEKMFTAQDERGVTLRKAIMAARDAGFLSRTSAMSKAQPQFSNRSSEPFHAAGAVDGPAGKPGRATLTPRFVGGRAAQRVDDPRSALDQLNELADAQRRQNTELTEAGAFARVYADPKNAELVRRERDENRPRATAW
jgi:hypothetical protein